MKGLPYVLLFCGASFFAVYNPIVILLVIAACAIGNWTDSSFEFFCVWLLCLASISVNYTVYVSRNSDGSCKDMKYLASKLPFISQFLYEFGTVLFKLVDTYPYVVISEGNRCTQDGCLCTIK